MVASAKTSELKVFIESVFPATFSVVAMESYQESQESYTALFEDKTKYKAIMAALAGNIYQEMRNGVRPEA